MAGLLHLLQDTARHVTESHQALVPLDIRHFMPIFSCAAFTSSAED